MASKPTKLLILFFVFLIECQDLNNKELTENSTNTEPSNNVTEFYNTTKSPIETTVEPMTSTSSSGDLSEYEPFRHYIHHKGDYCVCNLHLKWCDINCCCDIDCSESEKFSFGECETRKQIYDSRYCSHKNIVYINNTETSVEMSSNGLFCIVWDNTNQRHLFDDVDPINDVKRLLNIKPQHNYNWNLKHIKRVIKSNDSQFSKPDFRMKFGKNLLIAKQSNDSKIEDNWELPNSMVFRGGECNSLTKIKYLKDFRSSCYRFIRNLREDCVRNEYLDPKYFMSFDFVSKNDQNQSQINPEIEYKSPVFDPENKICRKSVKSVEYIVRHDGSNGIIDTQLSIETIDLKYKTQSFEQSFGVTFVWFNKSNAIELSGNPGYIVGKPILAALPSPDMNLTRDMSGYKILVQNNGLFCYNNMTKRSVQFGINSRTGCLLRVENRSEEDLCEAIQQTIDELLDSPLDDIGVFGNSSSDLSKDWIAIQTVNNKSIESLNGSVCPILRTGISLHIYYVFAGSANQPQHKIVGAVKRFDTQTDVGVKCFTKSVNCNDLFIELTTSVTFFDITKPARPDYAPPVNFKIQLPSDFFYPFLSNSINSLTVSKMLSLLIIIGLFIDKCFFW